MTYLITEIALYLLVAATIGFAAGWFVYRALNASRQQQLEDQLVAVQEVNEDLQASLSRHDGPPSRTFRAVQSISDDEPLESNSWSEPDTQAEPRSRVDSPSASETVADEYHAEQSHHHYADSADEKDSYADEASIAEAIAHDVAARDATEEYEDEVREDLEPVAVLVGELEAPEDVMPIRVAGGFDGTMPPTVVDSDDSGSFFDDLQVLSAKHVSAPAKDPLPVDESAADDEDLSIEEVSHSDESAASAEATVNEELATEELATEEEPATEEDIDDLEMDIEIEHTDFELMRDASRKAEAADPPVSDPPVADAPATYPPTSEAPAEPEPTVEPNKGTPPNRRAGDREMAEALEGCPRHAIDTIDGVDDKVIYRLHALGLENTTDLLRKCASASGLKALTASTGLDAKSVTRWTRISDLMRLEGVSAQSAGVLVNAGVNSVEALAVEKAKELDSRVRLKTANPPGSEELGKWIDEARRLRPLLRH